MNIYCPNEKNEISFYGGRVSWKKKYVELKISKCDPTELNKKCAS